MKPSVILLIIIDSLRADRMSCYGYRLKTTPFLDSILSDFAKFEWAFSSCSYTVPSVTSILTGKYPQNHSLGVYQTNYIYSRCLDNNKDILLQELLKLCGYKTYCIFSAPILHSGLGITKGFDKVYTENRERRPYIETTKITCNIINDATNPFFIFMHYFDVHIPYKYGHKSRLFDLENYKKHYVQVGCTLGPNTVLQSAELENSRNSQIYESSYDSSVFIVDDELRKVIWLLKSKNLYDNAMIIITSDHGELLGEDLLYCIHGVNLHPSLLRIPLLIKFPKNLSVSGIYNKAISNVSITPTIVSLCNINYNFGQFDGVNLVEFAETQPIALKSYNQYGSCEIIDNADTIELSIQFTNLAKMFISNFKYCLYNGKFILSKQNGKWLFKKSGRTYLKSETTDPYNFVFPFYYCKVLPLYIFLYRIIVKLHRIKAFLYKVITGIVRIFIKLCI